MPSAKTEITEIVTGLAITGAADARRALAAPPGRQRARRRVGPARRRWSEPASTGRSSPPPGPTARRSSRPSDGLRGRPPRLVEWKGPTQAPGDEVVPADLRVDHVWLISCKYLSKVLANAAPARLFDRGLAGGPDRSRRRLVRRGRRPTRTRRCTRRCALELGTRAALPPHAADLTPGPPSRAAGLPRRRLVRRRAAGLPRRSRWRVGRGVRRPLAARARQAGRRRGGALAAAADRQRAVLRARRASATGTLRLRVMTPWDWRQAYELKRIDVWGDDAGQPQVRWQAIVRDRATGEEQPSTATSRCAGATAASASRPRPRPTSTPPTTASPATSPWREPPRSVDAHGRHASVSVHRSWVSPPRRPP